MCWICEGILVCYEYNYLYILMFQIVNVFFKLFGDYFYFEDDEIEGFKCCFDECFVLVGSLGEGNKVVDWEIGDCFVQWWCFNIEIFMYFFVFVYIIWFKECKKFYLIQFFEISKFFFLVFIF